MNCDMCGKEDRLFKTNVEGSILNLCKGCSKFGKVISVVREEVKNTKKKPVEKTEIGESHILAIVFDYGSKIRKKREERGLTQDDFAKEIKEKASLIHKIEVNHFEPPMSLAKKIEKFLHISLIEQQDIKPESLAKIKSGHFTIADFIKKR